MHALLSLHAQVDAISLFWYACEGLSETHYAAKHIPRMMPSRYKVPTLTTFVMMQCSLQLPGCFFGCGPCMELEASRAYRRSTVS
mmetsp:Transcript_339/g.733  ORF Transcript_339/g.733 Transcript_339/m.733 type:complete len:85 (-) Transcript_339:147-401(-)